VTGGIADWCRHSRQKWQIPGIPGGYGSAAPATDTALPGVQQPQSNFGQQPSPQSFVPGFAQQVQNTRPQLPPPGQQQQQQQQQWIAKCLVDQQGDRCQFSVNSPVGSGVPCMCNGIQGARQ
jgi:hypothetical protein